MTLIRINGFVMGDGSEAILYLRENTHIAAQRSGSAALRSNVSCNPLLGGRVANLTRSKGNFLLVGHSFVFRTLRFNNNLRTSGR